MRYKLLGRSGLRVSELCLGAMTFGEEWGFGASKEESAAVLRAFVDAGGNFIDTANHYTGGTSERIVGELIAPEREQYVLATKYTLNPRPTDPNNDGNHRKNMVQSLEACLKRLATDYIDLYWVHAWDPMTPTEEMMRALDDMVRAGKILYVGISDAPAWVVSQANMLADLRGWTRFVGLQIQYSLVERTPERDLLPMARAMDITVTPWGALGGGVLTGKYTKDQPGPQGARLTGEGWGATFRTDRNYAIAEAVQAIAKEIDRTPSQVALAWLLAQRARCEIVPILGARKLSQIQDNLGALDVTLPAEALARLDQASRVDLGFPHDFLARARQFVYGATFDVIDNHRA